MNHDYIDIKGARENNLKNIDIRIPRDKFVIMTGVSGSGKTSLAFDTGLRRGTATVCGIAECLCTPVPWQQ